MKKFIAILALAFSAVAFADSSVIFETENYSNYDVYPEFQVNKELGRAWVNVVLSEYVGDSSNYYDNRVKIPGLSYKAETKEIVLEKDGQEIVCGKIINRRWVIDIGGSVKESGRCKFTTKKVKVVRDNGFETYKVPMLQVSLNVE
jgi:hypothetical protein